MKILLVSATEMEISPLLALFGQTVPRMHFHFGKLELSTLITGVGMTATAYSLGRELSSDYDFALNLGLAGSFHKGLQLGEVVHVVEDRFSELGAEDGEKFLSAQQLNIGIKDFFRNEKYPANNVLQSLPMVTGITVNTVHGEEKSIAAVYGRCHPYVESMEGAAFLMSCAASGVACAQVRAVSNYVERRDKAKWNIPLALSNLNQKIFEIIQAFEK
jgi:futalosine hydrolase